MGGRTEHQRPSCNHIGGRREVRIPVSVAAGSAVHSDLGGTVFHVCANLTFSHESTDSAAVATAVSPVAVNQLRNIILARFWRRHEGSNRQPVSADWSHRPSHPQYFPQVVGVAGRREIGKSRIHGRPPQDGRGRRCSALTGWTRCCLPTGWQSESNCVGTRVGTCRWGHCAAWP
jgi:hypothetical protein